MITNIKKVNYLIVELDKDDCVRLLLGDTIEEEESRRSEDCDPMLIRTYCSSPVSIQQLINHLTLMERNYEKKLSKGRKGPEES